MNRQMTRKEAEEWLDSVPRDAVFPRSVSVQFYDGGRQQANLYLPGLSKREYFAGLAMQASLSNPDLMENVTAGSDIPMDAIARVSVKAADALLAELSKEE